MANSKKFKEPDTYFDAEGIFDFKRQRKQSELNMEVSIGYGGIKTYIPAANDTAYVDSENGLVIPKGKNIIIGTFHIDYQQVAANLYADCSVVLAETGEQFAFEFNHIMLSQQSYSQGNYRRAQGVGVYYLDKPTKIAASIWVNGHVGKPVQYELSYMNFS